MSKINFKKGQNGELAYLNAKLKFKNPVEDNSMDVDTVINQERSKILVYIRNMHLLKNY